MSISVKYKSNAPGVITEYVSSNSLSVASNSTAVPAIAAPAAIMGSDTASKRIGSWLEFEQYYTSLGSIKEDVFYASLRSYFVNGGGLCYLLKVDKGLTQELARLDDVTLFVQAGQDLSTASDLATALEKLAIFAILDGTDASSPATKAANFPAITNSPNAAAYYPWLSPTTGDTSLKLPPSLAIAGVYCSNDREHGPWWTPANVSLQGLSPLYGVSDKDQADALSSLNMIRNLYRRPALVWGGRTQDDSDDWRYISVKRLFNMLQRDIRDALRRVVFNPNTPTTWQAARSAINAYLYSIWQRGGLAGSTQETAFFVNVGRNITMSDEDILQGILCVEIGVAAVRPAEFVVLRFSQIMGE